MKIKCSPVARYKLGTFRFENDNDNGEVILLFGISPANVVRDVGMFGMWGCGMWGCSGCGDVGCGDVGCGDVGCGDVRDVGMWDVGCWSGCGMWIHKMPKNTNH